MVFLGEEEAHARFLQQLRTAGWALLNVHPQRLQAVGRAALGRGGTVAVLGRLDPAGRGHQRRGGGDVEALCPVAAGADDLQHVHARIDLDGVVAHGGGAPGNLIGGFGFGALGGKGGQERGVLGEGGFAAHDLVHHGIGFVVGQVLLAHNFYNGFFDHGI